MQRRFETIETGVRPVVFLAIIALTTLVFVLQQLTTKPGWLTGPACGWQLVCQRSGRAEVRFKAAYPCQDIPACLGKKISPLISSGQVWRLLTPVLLHADLEHLTANMFALFFWARQVESILGRRNFLLLYLLSGFSGFVFSYLFEPAAALGASGAVFGVMAAWMVIMYRNHWVFGYAQAVLIGGYLLLNLYSGLQDPLIDNWGHLGGFTAGLWFAWQVAPAYQLRHWSPRSGYQIETTDKADKTLHTSRALFLGLLAVALVAWWLQR